MIRKLTMTLALLAVLAAPVLADHHMEGEPPMHPEVILGPPEGFEPPEGDEPPLEGDESPMGMAPEEMEAMMVGKFFELMDENGDGVIGFDEFMPWVRGSHMPPMDGEPMGDEPPMFSDGMTRDGILMAGDHISLAPECSNAMRDNELGPQAVNVPCGDREGNLIFRTICNMPGFESQAISLPDGRGADCFVLEALRGEIAFEIVSEDGTHIFDTSMGNEAFIGLKLEGPGVFTIKSIDGSPDGGVTVKFTDVPLD